MSISLDRPIDKIAMFTDIHFGAKANSEQHNIDCLNYVEWFCNKVRNDKNVNAVAFLGDWNENRSNINIHTLNYSYLAAKKLNELDIPIFFVIGNHDLYFKKSREIHSVIPFNEFTNFKVIEENTIIKNKGHHDVLICPYLFHDEYEDLVQYKDIPVWMGHFEFKGFIVTGTDIRMPTGPDASQFAGPKQIFSGHFHKRQSYENSNVVYIGNTFPTTFGDAGDSSRGMATYNFNTEETLFYDWEDGPRYIKTKLSDLLNDESRERILVPNAKVKCIVDIKINFDESNVIKREFLKEYGLREILFEEASAIQAAISDTELDLDIDTSGLKSVDDLVMLMLKQIKNKHIDNTVLIRLYQQLKTME